MKEYVEEHKKMHIRLTAAESEWELIEQKEGSESGRSRD